jgi:tRNA pseudouridine55 synthase
MRRNADRLDGFLLLDKPVGISSNRALQQSRGLLNARKAGHTGTLDPLASGVLPLAFGEATKFAADLLDADKSYRATLRLGQTTTTGDAEGAVLATRPVEVDDRRLHDVLTQFTGSIAQVPPMHSALKHEGRALYEYARAGVDIDRPARTVQIHRIERVWLEGHHCAFDVTCSKGTYVRTLAQDIGERLGCGAHLSGLRRTAVGPFDDSRLVSLEELAALAPAARRALLMPVDALLQGLPRIDLPADQARRIALGQRVALGDAAPFVATRTRIYDAGGQLLGMAALGEDTVLRPVRLLGNISIESENGP